MFYPLHMRISQITICISFLILMQIGYTAYCIIIMAIYWMTECIPMAVNGSHADRPLPNLRHPEVQGRLQQLHHRHEHGVLWGSDGGRGRRALEPFTSGSRSESCSLSGPSRDGGWWNLLFKKIEWIFTLFSLFGEWRQWSLLLEWKLSEPDEIPHIEYWIFTLLELESHIRISILCSCQYVHLYYLCLEMKINWNFKL